MKCRLASIAATKWAGNYEPKLFFAKNADRSGQNGSGQLAFRIWNNCAIAISGWREVMFSVATARKFSSERRNSLLASLRVTMRSKPARGSGELCALDV